MQHRSLAEFYKGEGPDLFLKCRKFQAYVDSVDEAGHFQTRYRIPILGPLDHRVLVKDLDGKPREMICFDSNSYLGLHLHPRVVGAVDRALKDFGYGTPSAQVLGGTTAHLLSLEELMADVCGREDALIFPTGYQANIAILTGLLRDNDVVFLDRYSHASIHDGCKYSQCATTLVFEHRDVEHLATLMTEHQTTIGGSLIVTDGLFSMHGDIAPLPSLLELGRRYDARVMVDDAHSLGILGASGKGIEEHFGLQGATDLYMGTFSKGAGSIGGYLCGKRDVITYLRFYARGSLFTASLPAAICAGLAESVRVMFDEPEHRQRLWANCTRLWNGFREIGLQLRPLESPIIPVRVGPEDKIGPLSVDLYSAGIKCGFAEYPAVPKDDSIMRFTVCSRHTPEDIDYTIDAVGQVARKHRIRLVEAYSPPKGWLSIDR